MATTAAIAGKTSGSLDTDDAEDPASAGEAKPGSRKRLTLIAAGAALLCLVLGLAAAYLGAFDELLGRTAPAKPISSRSAPPASALPVFFTLPDMVVNLSTSDGEAHMLRVKIALEVVDQKDVEYLQPLLPLIQDTLQTWLRGLTPNDLKGTAQYYRLRSELLQRIEFVAGPGHVRQAFFEEMIVR